MTNSPVEGATVTFECYKKQPLMLMHGTYVARRIDTVANETGKFQFSVSDVSGCTSANTYPAKTGYLDASVTDDGYCCGAPFGVPNRVFLVREQDVVKLRLIRLDPSKSTFSRAYEYTGWFTAFLEAKAIAQTEEDRKYVHEKYCAKLTELWADRTVEERATISNYGASFGWRGRSGSVRNIDYDKAVAPYCSEAP